MLDFGHDWTFVKGPFFFVEGHQGGEVPSGGREHPTDLYFECSLPTVPGLRARMNQDLSDGGVARMRGKLLLQHHDYRPELLQQAMIVPDQKGCLRLIRYDGSGILSGLRARWHIRRRTPFDVELGHR